MIYHVRNICFSAELSMSSEKNKVGFVEMSKNAKF